MLWTTRESQSLEELQAEEYLSKLSQPQTVKSLPVEVRKVESALSEERRWSMSSPPAYVKECSSLRDRTLHLQEIYSNLSNSEFISPLSNEMISQQQRDSKIRCTIFAWQRHSTSCQKNSRTRATCCLRSRLVCSRLGLHIGTTWHIKLNDSSVVAIGGLCKNS